MNNQMKRYIGKVWEGPEHRSSVLVELTYTALLTCECTHQPEALQTPYYWNLYGDFIMGTMHH